MAKSMTTQSAQELRVLFAGGGTAGHLLPALATEDALIALASEQGLSVSSSYLATQNGAELPILKKRGAKFTLVPKCDFPRKLSFDLITFLPRLTVAVLKALRVATKVDVVVGFGGYVALPAYLAAKITSKPLIIHEANALPGLANQVGKKFALNAFTNFPISQWSSSEVIGLPIRKSIWSIGQLSTAARQKAQVEARIALGLHEQQMTLLVFGGSLGAAKLNEVLTHALPALIDSGFQILHATGPGKELKPAATPMSTLSGYFQRSYISEMDQAYLAADVVISRSGAGSCAEILATGIPALLVPLSIGNGEQRLNAQTLENSGQARVITNEELNAENLVSAVNELVAQPLRFTDKNVSAAERMALAITNIVAQRKSAR